MAGEIANCPFFAYGTAARDCLCCYDGEGYDENTYNIYQIDTGSNNAIVNTNVEPYICANEWGTCECLGQVLYVPFSTAAATYRSFNDIMQEDKYYK